MEEAGVLDPHRARSNDIADSDIHLHSNSNGADAPRECHAFPAVRILLPDLRDAQGQRVKLDTIRVDWG
ncbi:MAG: hypothetical protein NT005_08080 [Spirochaetes bacterium]|nr:hypothetical protein [Spirochaetota bacterium]